MATKTILIDDFDGTDAVETIKFGLDGVTYSVDLNTEHAVELRGALSRFIEVGRKEGGTKRQMKTLSDGDTKIDTKAVRLWAAENGIQVNTRGRLQADVVEQYLAAH
jgi:hypothetical protein